MTVKDNKKRKKSEIKEFVTISKRHTDFSLVGHLLIASPNMSDDYFAQAVILLCSCDQNGSFGVMVNKPLMQMHSSAFCKGITSEIFDIFNGGPVDDETIFALATSQKSIADFNKMPELSLYQNAEMYVKDYLQKQIDDKFMLVKGYCSWAPNQLEAELADNSWLIMPPSFDMVFNSNYETKWETAIHNLKIKNLAGFVTYSGHD